jgi:hypothetical protein
MNKGFASSPLVKLQFYLWPLNLFREREKQD